MIRALSLDEWQVLDAHAPAPTFFARPAWSLALAAAMPSLEPFPVSVVLDGRPLLVPLMRSRARALRFSDAIAFPLGGYTCVLDGDGQPVAADDATRAVSLIARTTDHLRVIPWPLGPQLGFAVAPSAQFETAVIDCSDGFDAVMHRMRGVTRRMAGQAERRGVSCERASAHDMDEYYAMLCESARGWGRSAPSVDRRLFDAVLAYGGDDVELWFASVGGVRVAGGVVLYGANELFFWSAAMRRSFAAYRPSNALNVRLMRAACERGVRWYNLGASEGLEGVARFKHDLGAQSIAYAQYDLYRPACAAYHLMRAAFARKGRSA